ncbi:MAG: hypothetical protein FWF06_07515 [Symbiobacteriaceae bacterium]|nr:hypothetical protein [Symbiobacteriaceae bacterium]
MTLKAFAESYNFHDSSIVSMEYFQDTGNLVVCIELCNLMQSNYTPDMEDTTLIYLCFANADYIKNIEQYRDAEILKCEHINEDGFAELHIFAGLWVDPRHVGVAGVETYVSFVIRASSVSVMRK